MIEVLVTPEAIDVARETAAVQQTGAGAVATFIGSVRADDGVGELELEHYPGATEQALNAVAEQARDRWDLALARIVHRVGPIDAREWRSSSSPPLHRTAMLRSMHAVS